MSRIDKIKNGMGHIKRYADTVIAESYLEDVQFLLTKLEQAEKALDAIANFGDDRPDAYPLMNMAEEALKKLREN